MVIALHVNVNTLQGGENTEAILKREKDTKRMVRYAEVVAPGATPKIGTLYLRNDLWPTMPDTIKAEVTSM